MLEKPAAEPDRVLREETDRLLRSGERDRDAHRSRSAGPGRTRIRKRSGRFPTTCRKAIVSVNGKDVDEVPLSSSRTRRLIAGLDESRRRVILLPSSKRSSSDCGRRQQQMIAPCAIHRALHRIGKYASLHAIDATSVENFFSGGNGDFVVRSSTNSIPHNNPRPRTSPTFFMLPKFS